MWHVSVEVEILSQSTLPSFPQLHWGEGGKRDCGRCHAFRMYYLVWLQTGGEERAPPFFCVDPGWCRACGTRGDGAERARGSAAGDGCRGWGGILRSSSFNLLGPGFARPPSRYKPEDSEGQLCGTSDQKKKKKKSSVPLPLLMFQLNNFWRCWAN